MATSIALLRAVNLSGSSTVRMAELAAMFEALGLGPAKTLLSSGNVIFEGTGLDTGALEDLLARETIARLGLATTYFVRSVRDWRAAIAANPFADMAANEPGHLLLYALSAIPEAAAETRLAQAINGRESVRLVGAHVYACYPDGVGRSKLTLALIEKSLGVSATGRNWNTVVKIAALADSHGRR